MRRCAHSGMRAGTLRCPQTGPLPGAWAKSALPELERRLASGPYALYGAYDELDVAVVQLDPRVVADVDTPADLT